MTKIENLADYTKHVASVYTEERSDKMGIRHDYAPVYARLFSELVEKDHVKIAEIGVFKGSSIRAMLRLFDNAEIFGLDIVESHVDGATVVVGDGYSAETWSKLPDDLDLVIDDGSHNIVDMVRGLYVIFRHLKPGGKVLIEDIISKRDVDTLLDIFPGGEFIDSTATGANDDRIIVWTKPIK